MGVTVVVTVGVGVTVAVSVGVGVGVTVAVTVGVGVGVTVVVTVGVGVMVPDSLSAPSVQSTLTYPSGVLELVDTMNPGMVTLLVSLTNLIMYA